VAMDCFLSPPPCCDDGPGDALPLPLPRDDGLKEDVGEIGESNRENGFFSAGYPGPPLCLISSTGTGGMATPAEPPFVKAFLSEAREPFRFAKKPGVEPVGVPGPARDDEEPLLSLPNLATSMVFGVGIPTE